MRSPRFRHSPQRAVSEISLASYRIHNISDLSRGKFTKSRKFPGTLRRLRLGRGLTQERLAELARVPKGAISLWELGNAKPDSGQLEGLSRALRVSVDELLGLTRLTGDAALAANVNLPKVCDQLRVILRILEQALAEPRDAAKRRARKS